MSSWHGCVSQSGDPDIDGILMLRGGIANTNVTVTLLGLLIALFGPMLLAIAGRGVTRASNWILPHLFGLAALLAMVISILWIVLRSENQTLSSIGVQRFRCVTMVWGLGLAAFFMAVFAPAACWTLDRLNLGGFDAGIAKNAGLPLWYLISAVLVGSISEEVLYRGYAVERIAVLTGSRWLGGIASVLVYGLAHVPMWGWGPALTTVVSGGIFTLFFVWRRDLVANIIAHVFTDIVGIVLVPVLHP